MEAFIADDMHVIASNYIFNSAHPQALETESIGADQRHVCAAISRGNCQGHALLAT
jgi:hypothetical protein